MLQLSFKVNLRVVVYLIHLFYWTDVHVAIFSSLFQKLTLFNFPFYVLYMSSQRTLNAISVTHLLMAAEDMII